MRVPVLILLKADLNLTVTVNLQSADHSAKGPASGLQSFT